jgi:hypothetical protein
MLYSKRCKNLGGGRKKRSNRKSYKSVMSGGSSPHIQQKVIWQWRSDSGFVPYSETDNIIIEQAYQTFDNKVTLNINSRILEFDFVNMTQYNPDTNGQRQINRYSIANVDELCDLIYKNIPINNIRYIPYFNYIEPDFPHKERFSVTPAQRIIINSTSSLGFTPLYTACRNHSSMYLITKLIENTDNLSQLCGLPKPDSFKNTAAHAIAYSYFIPIDAIRQDGITKADADAKKDFKCTRSIQDKLKILDLFKTRGFRFNTLNSLDETIWDLIYETETIKCRDNIKTYDILAENFNKYNTDEISRGIIK